jgi:Ca2+-binding EF-hand superfamily protein
MYNIKEVLGSKKLLHLVSKQIFDAVDSDGSGQISEDELHTILCSLAEDFGFERPSVTETQQILEFVDIDRSGLIEIDEFRRLLKKVLKAVRDNEEKRKKRQDEEDEDIQEEF